MAVRQLVFPSIEKIEGIRLATASAGFYSNRQDMALIEIQPDSQTAAVFTKNAFVAAPVKLAQRHLALQQPRYFLVNAGNANAGTGQRGMDDALACCHAVAEQFSVKPEQVLPFSTGVIGVDLPTQKMLAVIPSFRQNLDALSWKSAASAIMTTDTQPKAVSRQIEIDGQVIRFAAFAKGAGMIRPDMATMLAFMFTDARMEQRLLQTCLEQAVSESYHCISIDGDTSTNDAACLVATGHGVSIDARNNKNLTHFQQALTELCVELAKMIICDGEGATKLITIHVTGGESEAQCRQIAFTVAHSPLVKTAFYASDPNWGRILAAIGRSGVSDLEIDQIGIFLDKLCVFRHGERSPDYTEAQALDIMSQSEILLHIKLDRGHRQTKIWTSDLSHDYITINAEYRS